MTDVRFETLELALAAAAELTVSTGDEHIAFATPSFVFKKFSVGRLPKVGDKVSMALAAHSSNLSFLRQSITLRRKSYPSAPSQPMDATSSMKAALMTCRHIAPRCHFWL